MSRSHDTRRSSIDHLIEKGDFEAVVETLKRMIADEPRDKEAHVLLAMAYAKAEMGENAIKEYKIALDIDPLDTLIRNRLGVTYLSEGRFEDAEREFGEILKRRPGDIVTLASMRAVRKLKAAAMDLKKRETYVLARGSSPEESAKMADIEKMTGEFCDRYLNDEYRFLVEKLIGKIACEPDTPFMRGRPEIWAAAMIYALGQCNDLFRKGSSPHATPDDICDYFGVKQLTVINKAAQIRKRFDIGRFGGEFSMNPLWKYIHPRSS